MSAALVRRWLASGALNLPLPGSGDTARRWKRLAELAETDVVSGRLAEAHVDAVAILAELGGRPPRPDQLWGVWAAESREAVLRARSSGDLMALEGTKAWCSGAGLCTHALVSACLPDGSRGLFAVELDHPAILALPSTWRNAGMQASATRSVQFSNAPAVPIGRAGDYLDRPGFWHGAAGVAACWLGGARAVAAPLYQAGSAVSPDAHVLAHLGAVDAAIAAGEAMLVSTASRVDADPTDRSGDAERLARRTRAVVETAVDEAITRTGRALGPGPLALDSRHARHVADLMMYVRQSHAERDLAALGGLAAARQ
ncbi:MAG: acyl-CoA dehydrogenase [Mycolicibacterium sp.]|nr:acyl-CoA dehydrogenase [Mycolicibacterium sp.]